MVLKHALVVILLTLLHVNNIVSIQYDECENEAYNTYVRSSESCQSYLICLGDESEKLSCDEGEYFDMERGSCDLEENVFCPLDEEEQDADDEADADGEEGEDGEEEQDENEDAEYVDENETETEVINKPIDRRNNTSGNETTTFNTMVIAPIVKDVCPNIDNPNEIIMMQNNQSCSDYYLCYHGQAIQMHCTDSLHFNKKTGKCDYPEKAQCSLDRPNTLKCTPNTTALFPHPGMCNYFYYCIKGFLTIQHCPHYYGWDIDKRSCVLMTQANCYKNARRT